MFFARYDQDGNFVLTSEETNKILTDINQGKVDKPVTSAETRPRSGKEARSARSARILSSAQSRRKSMALGGVSGEEYQV